MQDPAFLFYTKDFQSGTQDMSCCEVGAYLRLLMYQHQHGFIPDDHQRLMRITSIFDINEFLEIWDIVSKKFDKCQKEPNHLVNQKLNQVVDQRTKYQPKKIAAAVLAGLISSNKTLSFDQKEIIKKSFKINEFIEFSELELKEKVKEWFTKMVNQMVNYLAIGNAIVIGNENINENEVFNLKSEISKKSKSEKSKVEVLPKFHDEMVEVLEVWNQVRGKSYRTFSGFQKNYEYWRQSYSFEEICQAVKNTTVAKWWSTEDIDISVLFNKKKQNGSDADHIGSLLNVTSTENKNQIKSATNAANAAMSIISKLEKA